jgi:hypothetical protein
VKFKKSQVVMEFLMTYGWAILVVLIAIGALAYFDVFTPEKFTKKICTCNGSDIRENSLVRNDTIYLLCSNYINISFVNNTLKENKNFYMKVCNND